MIRRLFQFLVFLAAVLMVAGIVLYIQKAVKAQAARPALQKEEVVQHPEVSVTMVSAGSYHARITGFGSVSPHFELTLTARVSGQVKTLSNAFETGKRIKKGELMAALDDTEYRQALATAQKELSDAQLSLLEEQRQAVQAKAEWQSSGLSGEPASELVLRGPQVAAAKQAVAAAKAAVETAKADLSHTKITAPFDALVVERSVSPGSFVQAGSTLAALYSTDRAEITVSLSDSQWSGLPDTKALSSGKWPVTLVHAQSGREWTGYILRALGQVDEKSRQQRLIVALDSPLDSDPPLLFNTFVKVTINGQTMDNLWELPGSAFSQKGEIWYVAADNTLASFSTEPLFSYQDAVYVIPPEDLAGTPRKILIHPLSHYLKGMTVNPVEEK